MRYATQQKNDKKLSKCHNLTMIYVISTKNIYAARRLKQEVRIMKQEVRIMDINDLLHHNFNLIVHQNDVLYVRNPYLNPVREPSAVLSCHRFKLSPPSFLPPHDAFSNGVNGSPKYISHIIKLAKKFKAMGGRVVDGNIINGQIGLGKWFDYRQLLKSGLPIPKTVIASASEAISLLNRLPCRLSDALKTPRNDKYGYPLILKWIYGMKAKGTFLIQNQEQFKKTVKLHPKNEWLVQEFIKARYEYKVICVGYKALPIILRFGINKNGFGVYFDSYSVIPSVSDLSAVASAKVGESLKVNISSNVKGSLHSPPLSETKRKWGVGPPWLAGSETGRDDMLKVVYLAEVASKLLGRELSKVDILEDHKGKFYILEVNRFPGLKSFEQLTGFNVAKEFVKYLKM